MTVGHPISGPIRLFLVEALASYARQTEALFIDLGQLSCQVIRSEIVSPRLMHALPPVLRAQKLDNQTLVLLLAVPSENSIDRILRTPLAWEGVPRSGQWPRGVDCPTRILHGGSVVGCRRKTSDCERTH